MVWSVKVGYLKTWYFCAKKKGIVSTSNFLQEKNLSEKFTHKKLFIVLTSSFYLRKCNIHLRYLKDILMKRNWDIL